MDLFNIMNVPYQEALSNIGLSTSIFGTPSFETLSRGLAGITAEAYQPTQGVSSAVYLVGQINQAIIDAQNNTQAAINNILNNVEHYTGANLGTSLMNIIGTSIVSQNGIDTAYSDAKSAYDQEVEQKLKIMQTSTAHNTYDLFGNVIANIPADSSETVNASKTSLSKVQLDASKDAAQSYNNSKAVSDAVGGGVPNSARGAGENSAALTNAKMNDFTNKYYNAQNEALKKGEYWDEDAKRKFTYEYALSQGGLKGIENDVNSVLGFDFNLTDAQLKDVVNKVDTAGSNTVYGTGNTVIETVKSINDLPATDLWGGNSITNTIVGAVTGALDNATGGALSGVDSILNKIASTLSGLGIDVKSLSTNASNAVQWIVGAAAALPGEIQKAYAGAISKATEIVEAAKSDLQYYYEKGLGMLNTVITTAADKLKSAYDWAAGNVGTIVTVVSNTFAAQFAPTLLLIKTAIDNFSGIKDWIVGLLKDPMAYVDKLVQMLQDEYNNLTKTDINALVRDGLKTLAVDLVDGMVGAYKELGIAIPTDQIDAAKAFLANPVKYLMDSATQELADVCTDPMNPNIT